MNGSVNLPLSWYSFSKACWIGRRISKLAYIHIFSRVWWSAKAREFGQRLDFVIDHILKRDHDIKVKTINAPSLLEYRYNYSFPYGQQREALRAFLKADNTHLNFWGYEALINEVGVPLMDARAAPYCRPRNGQARYIEVICSNRRVYQGSRNNRYFPY